MLTNTALALIQILAATPATIAHLGAALNLNGPATRTTLLKPVALGLVEIDGDTVVALTKRGRGFAIENGFIVETVENNEQTPKKKGHVPAAEVPAAEVPAMMFDLANPLLRKPALDLLVAVPCPHCGAGIGGRCKNPGGSLRNRNSPHAPRRDAALALAE